MAAPTRRVRLVSQAARPVEPAVRGDVVVTVPKRLWLEWLAEGDLAYAVDSYDESVTRPTLPPPAPWEGTHEYGFNLGGHPPTIRPGERVYVVAHGRLRGYSPLVRVEYVGARRFGGRENQYSLVRRGDAVACTINEPIRGFQGWRYRWWPYNDETPYPNWRTDNVPAVQERLLP